MMRCYTEINEINLKIFVDVDDETLVFLCQTNRYINSLSNEIWYRKLCLIFPEIPKINNFNGAKSYYFYKDKSYLHLEEIDELKEWLTSPQNAINLYIEKGDYLFLKECLDVGILPVQKSVNVSMKKISASMGQEDFPQFEKNIMIVQLLMDNQIYCSVDVAVKCGHCEITDILLKKGDRPSQKSMDKTVNEYVLALLIEYDIYQNIDRLVDMNYLDLAKILLDKGKRPNATTVDNLNNRFNIKDQMLNLLAEYNIYQSIDVAIKNNFLVQEIITYNNAMPSQEAIDYCVRNPDYKSEQCKTLIILNKNGFWCPDQNFASNYFQLNHYHELMLLVEAGIFRVDEQFINQFIYSLFNNYMPPKNVIELCINTMNTFNVYPDEKHVDLCYEKEFSVLINYFISQKMFPSQQRINTFCKSNNYIMITRLIKYDIFPDREFINLAVENNYQYIIKVLDKCGKL